MRPDFYRKFEDRFRGSQERIFSRLKVYIPFVYPFRDLFSAPVALDLGCGRGEWLQLVSQNGFDAQGTDLDAGMLETAKAKGFFVQNEDALAYLKKKENESVCLVSGFHIAEHLPFDVLVDLALEAFRVLVPGGLLILETPNPENVVVGCRNFYMDPTHNHPIPPDLLSFVADYAGFGRVKVLRLQESPELMKKSNLSLLDVLGGVSPDYSVVAQKDARTEILTRFDEPFAKTYGFDLYQLGSLWQQQAEAKAAQAEAKAAQAEAKAAQAETKAAQAEGLARSIMESRSWKITAPLRLLARLFRLVKRHFKKSINATVQSRMTDYHQWQENRYKLRLAADHFDSSSWNFMFTLCIEIDAALDFPTRLVRTLESLSQQSFHNFEILVLGAGRKSASLVERLMTNFIKFRGLFYEPHLKVADFFDSASAEILLRGDYVMFLPAGTVLDTDAFACINRTINAASETELPALVLCDYDHFDLDGCFSNPVFSPGWDPDFFLAQDYIGTAFLTSKDMLSRHLRLAGSCDSSRDWLRSLATSSTPFPTCHVCDTLIHLPTNCLSGCTLSPLIIDYPLPESPIHVAVIIPNKDRPELLERCLTFLRFETRIHWEIVIVDNASTDIRTLMLYDELQQQHQAKIIKMDSTFNFSRMINMGVASSSSPVLLLLNNDVEITRSGTTERLLSHALRPEVGIVGSKLLYPDGTVQHSGMLLGGCGESNFQEDHCYIGRHVMRGARGDAPGYLNNLQTIRNYQSVTGALMMIRRQVFDQVGNFEEIHLPVEYNDVDYCLRVRQAGYRVVCLPSDGIYHREASTRSLDNTPGTLEMRRKAIDYMKSCWRDKFKSDPYDNPRINLGDCDDPSRWYPNMEVK